jgi:hypothetical protein
VYYPSAPERKLGENFANKALRGWLHVCDFMCDLLQIADAICCVCDLVSDSELLPFTRTMRFAVRFAVRFGARNGSGNVSIVFVQILLTKVY